MSQTILLVIHILITAALIGVVLIQRSEGGGLGMGGGGGGMGSFMSVRGTANLLTRATTILAACFVASSLTLAILAKNAREPASILEGSDPVPAAEFPLGDGVGPPADNPAPDGPTIPVVPLDQ